MITLKRILFPTDFSPFSEHALGYAVSFAREFEAKLYVLHVIEDLAHISYFEVFQVPLPANLLEDVQARSQAQMDALMAGESLAAIDAESIIRMGAPFVEILGTAAELKVDLITIATHGRTGLQQVLFGSTAEKVVRKAPCPVLSIRHPEHEFVMP